MSEYEAISTEIEKRISSRGEEATAPGDMAGR